MKPAPAADVVDPDQVEVGVAGCDIGDETLQRRSAIDQQTAFAFVGVAAHDPDVAQVDIFLDLVGLVVRGVLLSGGEFLGFIDQLEKG